MHMLAIRTDMQARCRHLSAPRYAELPTCMCVVIARNVDLHGIISAQSTATS